jgi:hypothetical protein
MSSDDELLEDRCCIHESASLEQNMHPPHPSRLALQELPPHRISARELEFARPGDFHAGSKL